jgi:hypothetical protein
MVALASTPHHREPGSTPSSALRWSRVLLHVVVVAMLLKVGIRARRQYVPSAAYVRAVARQKQFAHDFGAAVCDTLERHDHGQVFLQPLRSFAQCAACGETMQAPPEYLQTLSDTDNFFQMFAKTVAERQCPAAARRLMLNNTPAAYATTGVDTSAAMRRFYEMYHSRPAGR